MVTLKSCVETLKSSPSADPGKEERSVCLRIDKKLYKCRNPDKLDFGEYQQGAEEGWRGQRGRARRQDSEEKKT